MKDDKLYLIHISECIERVESYVHDVDKNAFLESSLIQDEVIRNLQVMAESTQRLSDKNKDNQPHIDWLKISGFRNVLVHDYLGVDPLRVWNIILNELPVLKKAIREMMR